MAIRRPVTSRGGDGTSSSLSFWLSVLATSTVISVSLHMVATSLRVVASDCGSTSSSSSSGHALRLSTARLGAATTATTAQHNVIIAQPSPQVGNSLRAHEEDAAEAARLIEAAMSEGLSGVTQANTKATVSSAQRPQQHSQASLPAASKAVDGCREIVPGIVYECYHLGGEGSCVPSASTDLDVVAEDAPGFKIVNTKSGMRIITSSNPNEAITFHIDTTDDVVCPRDLMETLRESRNVGRTETLLDVGSNIGSCAMYALRYGHKVIAVEPDQANIEVWRRNMLLNADVFNAAPVKGKAYLLPIAAADKDTTLTLFQDPRNTGNSVVVDLSVPNAKKQFDEWWKQIGTVCVYSIDNIASRGIIKELSAVTLLKVDVQGHETAAIHGLGSVILPQKSLQEGFVEISPMMGRAKGLEPATLFKVIDNAGLNIHITREPMSEDFWKEMVSVEKWNGNMQSFFEAILKRRS